MTTLNEVHKVIQKWLYLKSMNRVDLMLAVHLSRELKGTKLWLIFVGGSGGSKSELLRSLNDNEKTTYDLQEITPNTLVSGNPCARDLAPQLDNKTVLIMDMAILLNLKKEEKAKIWAQLRELYDGNCSKMVGSGKPSIKYTGLNITLIACSTGAIDDQILIHNTLGTRELLYRISPIIEAKEGEAIMQKVLENEKNEESMRNEIKEVIQDFLKTAKCKEIDIPQEIMEQIQKLVNYTIVMRSQPQIDSYSGDLISTVEHEFPTRVLKQYKRIYQSLMSLSDVYVPCKALEIITEIAESSIHQDRIRVLEFLIKNPDEYNYCEIGQDLKLGNSSIKRHCSVLWNLGLIHRNVYYRSKFDGTDDKDGRELFKWKLNMDSSIVRFKMKLMGLDIEEQEKLP